MDPENEFIDDRTADPVDTVMGGDLDDSWADFSKGDTGTGTATETATSSAAPETEVETPAPETKVETKVETPAPETKVETKTEDEFDKLKLPAHARASTATQFEEAKNIGRRLVTEEKTKREAAEKKVADLEAKLAAGGSGGDPELAGEVEDHRKFRRLYDFQNSPAFKKMFDAPIEKQENLLLDRLAKLGYGADAKEVSEKIAPLGGLAKLDWSKALAGLDEFEKRKFLREVDKLEDAKEQRGDELERAKTDKDAFEAYMAKQPDQETARASTGMQHAVALLNHGKMFDVIPIDKLPEGILSKEHAEAVNAGVEAAKKFVDTYKDASPQTFGELLAIGAAAQRYLSVNRYLGATLKTKDTELATVRQELTAMQEKYGKIKQAGRSVTTPAAAAAVASTDSDSMDDRFNAFLQGQR